MKFIEVHSYYDGMPQLINIGAISNIIPFRNEYGQESVNIYLINSAESYYKVKESYSEIKKLIK